MIFYISREPFGGDVAHKGFFAVIIIAVGDKEVVFVGFIGLDAGQFFLATEGILVEQLTEDFRLDGVVELLIEWL